MEPYFLDLRDKRCPISLLMVKQYARNLLPGDSGTILISDPISMKDILKYLQAHACQCECEQLDDYFQLKMIKGRH
ncbi:sulfurtransferase TusA family protein [Vibrio mangrovi]|uniref:SirA-like protein n=1 Tax=Vibrio mangrovi TaxID=474394 RepID=A0A1Y6IS26_9VIBR|nr:sulfurtransferase TusA family protein [Vibrio mangrovi]MDW6001540.1 sulfurtransferase TusA family protein [Vibrio mangrovi]SMS00436.1 SirA-like protein [Vibrio mangrovi]